jgi:chemotaxis receptor (MCP) glutamine deamidase CheD
VVLEGTTLAHDLIRETVAADTYRVSAEPMQLFAELSDALALCVHDEAHGVGGLLHLRFVGDEGRTNAATDQELNSLLRLLDGFKKDVLEHSPPSNAVQARILAHASPSAKNGGVSATLVDLIKADLADVKIVCGTQTLQRPDPVQVCFQPREGRVRILAPAPGGVKTR